MSTTVPMQPVLPAITAIRGGVPVSSSTWQPASGLMNHLLGRGAVLVPAFSPGLASGIVATTSRDFRFYTQLQAQTVALAWEVQLRSLNAAGSTVAITTPTSGSSVSYTVTNQRGQRPIRHIEARTSQSAAEAEISIRIAPTVNDVEVTSISCWAIPRATLVRNTTDYGIDDATQGRGQDIYAPAAGGGLSLGALMLDVAQAKTAARRIGLIQLGLPDVSTGADAFQVTGAMAPLYTGGAPITARKIGRSATTGTVSCRVLAWASAAGTTYGTLQVDTTSGGAATTTIALGTVGTPLTATPTWYPLVAGAPGSFSVSCDDYTTSDGLQAATYDDVSFQASRDGGAATIYVATISCWEAP